jgi:hypothetical protein
VWCERERHTWRGDATEHTFQLSCLNATKSHDHMHPDWYRGSRLLLHTHNSQQSACNHELSTRVSCSDTTPSDFRQYTVVRRGRIGFSS